MNGGKTGDALALELNTVLTTDLQGSLKCGVCCSTLKNPVSPPCNHPFCNDCLVECFKKKNKVECPICRASITRRVIVPSDHIERIVKAYLELASSFKAEIKAFSTEIPFERKFAESQAMTQAPSTITAKSEAPPVFAVPFNKGKKRKNDSAESTPQKEPQTTPQKGAQMETKKEKNAEEKVEEKLPITQEHFPAKRLRLSSVPEEAMEEGEEEDDDEPTLTQQIGTTPRRPPKAGGAAPRPFVLPQKDPSYDKLSSKAFSPSRRKSPSRSRSVSVERKAMLHSQENLWNEPQKLEIKDEENMKNQKMAQVKEEPLKERQLFMQPPSPRKIHSAPAQPVVRKISVGVATEQTLVFNASTQCDHFSSITKEDLERTVKNHRDANPDLNDVSALFAAVPWLKELFNKNIENLVSELPELKKCQEVSRETPQPGSSISEDVVPATSSGAAIAISDVDVLANVGNDADDEDEGNITIPGTQELHETVKAPELMVAEVKEEPVEVEPNENEQSTPEQEKEVKKEEDDENFSPDEENLLDQTIAFVESPLEETIPLTAPNLVLCTSRVESMKDQELVQEFCQRFPLIRFTPEIDESTTHLIMMNVEDDSPRVVKSRSLRYVMAIARQCELVSKKWMEECVKTEQILSTEAFTLLNDKNMDGTPWERSKKYNAQLFIDWRFYVPSKFAENSVVPRKDVVELIRLTGGEIITKDWDIKPPNCRILFAPGSKDIEDAKRYEEVKNVEVNYVDFVLDAIAQFEIPTNGFKYRVWKPEKTPKTPSTAPGTPRPLPSSGGCNSPLVSSR